jgi:hypothetical protein
LPPASSDDAAMRHEFLYRWWEEGQRHLAAGRYGAARRALVTAEMQAWRCRDASSLARIYLPLLEVRRLLRYQAVEGRIVIGDSRMWRAGGGRVVREFLRQTAGTILLPGDTAKAMQAVKVVRMKAGRTGKALEALMLLEQGGEVRVAAAEDARIGAGLPVEWTGDERAAVGESTQRGLRVPLPSPGVYEGKAAGLGAVARESLIVAWEALALRWQGRHALPRRARPWEEMAWLRRTLRVDGACEPVTMRLVALAEGLQRGA